MLHRPDRLYPYLSYRAWARVAFAFVLALGVGCAWRPVVIPPLAGTVWQIDNQTLDPRGSWQQMGATELLVQWTAVDGIAYVENGVVPTASHLPA